MATQGKIRLILFVSLLIQFTFSDCHHIVQWKNQLAMATLLLTWCNLQ